MTPDDIDEMITKSRKQLDTYPMQPADHILPTMTAYYALLDPLLTLTGQLLFLTERDLVGSLCTAATARALGSENRQDAFTHHLTELVGAGPLNLIQQDYRWPTSDEATKEMLTKAAAEPQVIAFFTRIGDTLTGAYDHDR